jgi:hypothetical protein
VKVTTRMRSGGSSVAEPLIVSAWRSNLFFAESDNVHDPNAISVWIDGMRVGYLSREDAEVYRPGLLALQAREGKLIGLCGVIAGGGMREDGPGFLGVWMLHDPDNFGLSAVVPAPMSSMRGRCVRVRRRRC